MNTLKVRSLPFIVLLLLVLNQIDRADPLDTWVQRGSGTGQNIGGIAYGGGRFVATTANTIISSEDGATWVQRQSLSVPDLVFQSLAYTNGQFIAGAFDLLGTHHSGFPLTSSNGVDWVHQPQQSITNFLASFVDANPVSIYHNGLLVRVGHKNPAQLGSTIQTSTDGTNWVQRFSATGYALDAITYGSGLFMAVGFPGFPVVTSTDGINWVHRSVGSADLELTGVAYGNGHFVAVGAFGVILQSASIDTLELTPDAGTGLLSLSLGGLSGLDYTIQSSADLISWHEVTKITSPQSGKIILDGLPVGSGHTFYRAYSQ